jgi:hypothetical protein
VAHDPDDPVTLVVHDSVLGQAATLGASDDKEED